MMVRGQLKIQSVRGKHWLEIKVFNYFLNTFSLPQGIRRASSEHPTAIAFSNLSASSTF